MIGPVADFNVSGVEFIAAMLAGAAEFFWLPAARLRQGAWGLAAAAVVWLVLPNAASAEALAAFLLSGYAAARALRARPSGWLLGGYLTLLVAAFLLIKQYAVLDWLLPAAVLPSRALFGLPIRGGLLVHAVRITGLSYIFFRQIHVLVDAAEGQLESFSLWDYLNYQLNPFTLLAGPIQRYQEFDAQFRELSPVLESPERLLDNCMRLLWGVVKVALIGPFFYEGWDTIRLTMLHASGFTWKYLAEFPVVFYFYPVYLYCNFSGYCDIVIAAARFFGMRLPENFDRPWLARNVIEFWTRWHVTLGTWIRDYLFMPMYKPVVRVSAKLAASLVWLFYFAAFTVAGAWHGATLNFLLYGAWQGLGMSATKLYESFLLRRLGRKGLQDYRARRWVRWAAIFLNLQFQCVSLLIFSQRDVGDAWRLVRGAGLALAGLGRL